MHKRNIVRRECARRLTESFSVHLQGGGSGGWVAEPVLGHTLDESVVAAGADRADAQHGALRDRDHRIAVVAVSRRDAAAAGAPEVHVRRRVAGRQADERRDAAVDHLLVARSLSDARRV